MHLNYAIGAEESVLNEGNRSQPCKTKKPPGGGSLKILSGPLVFRLGSDSWFFRGSDWFGFSFGLETLGFSWNLNSWFGFSGCLDFVTL